MRARYARSHAGVRSPSPCAGSRSSTRPRPRKIGNASELSELCVGVRGNARHPRRAASHFAEGLFCPPAGGAPALLDGRNPLEYLST